MPCRRCRRTDPPVLFCNEAAGSGAPPELLAPVGSPGSPMRQGRLDLSPRQRSASETCRRSGASWGT
eukprot:11257282-Alexandrium_andersonii.AAC.1